MPSKPTAATRMREQRRQVALLVADGMSPEKIAAVMGFAVDKLQAVFAHQLEHGREIVRAEVLMRFDAAGDDGSVPANRSLESITAGSSIPPSPLGKKAAADAQARAAAGSGNKFAPPGPPRGVGKKAWANHRSIDAASGTQWDELFDLPQDGEPN